MKPQVTWYRRVGGVFHAAVESSQHSWVRTGQVLCGRMVGTPGFTTGQDYPAAHLPVCKLCARKLTEVKP